MTYVKTFQIKIGEKVEVKRVSRATGNTTYAVKVVAGFINSGTSVTVKVNLSHPDGPRLVDIVEQWLQGLEDPATINIVDALNNLVQELAAHVAYVQVNCQYQYGSRYIGMQNGMDRWEDYLDFKAVIY